MILQLFKKLFNFIFSLLGYRPDRPETLDKLENNVRDLKEEIEELDKWKEVEDKSLQDELDYWRKE